MLHRRYVEPIYTTRKDTGFPQDRIRPYGGSERVYSEDEILQIQLWISDVFDDE